MERCELDLYGSGQAPVANCCQHDNEPSGFTKCLKFLEWLSNYWLVKKN
jgi:hypothetical protein